MRIALVSTCALPTPPQGYGGTELMVAELAKGLVQLDHRVTVFATGDSTPVGALHYHLEKPVWPPSDLAELRHAGFAWQDIARMRARFDVVHVHHHAALPFHALVGLPTVLTIHHARDDALSAHYRAYRDVSYVAISERQAALHPDLRFASVIHHGLDPSAYPAGAGTGEYVAFLGRFAPEKAPHLAIEAARKAGVPICLGGAPHAVCMDYFEREVKPLLAEPDMQGAWRGELTHGPKLQLLQGARALLVPSQWEEPFGLVMIEAMLVGTPVIAVARGSAPEIVEDGVTGFLVRDVDELTERIGQLASIDRQRCRARAQERFSHLRMAADYAELYARIARGPERPLGMGRVIPLSQAASHAASASRTEPIVRAHEVNAHFAEGSRHGSEQDVRS